MRLASVAILLAVVSCDEPPPEPQEPAPLELVSVRVEPEVLTLESGPGGGADADFVAWGTYEDGEERPLDVVSWSLSNPTAGVLDADGSFHAATTNGGVTWVTATLSGVSGQATVTVRYVDVVDDPAVDPAWFELPTEMVTGSWRYPEANVALPRNTPSIHWQWVDPATLPGIVADPARGYRVSFQSELTQITWYTPLPELRLDDLTWQTIASTNAGGEVNVTIEAATTDRVLVEYPIAVQVRRMDAQGSVIYWSTTESGLVEIPFGGEAQPFLTAAQTGRCLGCHAISSQGLVAFTFDGGHGPLAVQDIATGGAMPSYGGGNFQTFSPDGTMLMTATHGNLEVKDPYTGALINVPVATANGTHPDWSPDGTQVVFTQSDGHDADWTIDTPTRIAVMDHLGSGQFSPPRVLFQAPPGYRAYYPAWSPDGQWVAFNVSTGDCYDDPDAQVYVGFRTGDVEPVPLTLANGQGALTNSWPRWAPLPDDDVMWLAFASRRRYGNQIDGQPQIWVAAVDPAALAAGVDPSRPAFWLPGQPIGTGNHIPVWVE